MIIKKTFYGVKCDRCEEMIQGDESSFYADEKTAINMFNAYTGITKDLQHYCENCIEYSEEQDE